MAPNDVVALIAICILGGGIAFPLVRALARRIERGGAALPLRPAADDERLRRIEQAVEAMAVEVERIAEGQRYTTKLLSARPADAAALPTGDGSR